MSISDWSSDVCSSDLHFKIIFQIKIEIPLHFPGHQPVRPAVITPETDIKRFGSIDHRYFGAFSSQLADIQFPLGKITDVRRLLRSEEHTSELQSLMRISYAVFCLKKKINKQAHKITILTRFKHKYYRHTI